MPKYICIIADPDNPSLDGLTTFLLAGDVNFWVSSDPDFLWTADGSQYALPEGFDPMVEGSSRLADESEAILYLPSTDPHTVFLAGMIYGTRYEGDVLQPSESGSGDGFGVADDFALFYPSPSPLSLDLPPLPPLMRLLPVLRSENHALMWCRMVSIGNEELKRARVGDPEVPLGCVGWCDLYREAESPPSAPTAAQWSDFPRDGRTGLWTLITPPNGWRKTLHPLRSSSRVFTTTVYRYRDGSSSAGGLFELFREGRWWKRWGVSWPMGTRRYLW